MKSVARCGRTGTFLLAVTLLISACTATADTALEHQDPIETIHAAVEALEDVMVYDVFSPPLASRAYTYPLIAFYEAVRHEDEAYLSFAGQLRDLHDVPAPTPGEEYDFLLAGVHAFSVAGARLVFSRHRFEDRMEPILAAFDRLNIPRDVYDRSVKYGQEMGRHILEWCARDHYAETRNMPRYALINEPGFWQPTGPEYMSALEPHWARLRPFVLDTVSRYSTGYTPVFSLEPGSAFYEQVMEVYEVGRDLTDEQRDIARFWNDNPFEIHYRGHLKYGITQASPGAHWIRIAGLVSRMANDTPARTLATYSLVSIAIADGFMACWADKYRTHLVRPETVIRQHIDPAWQPVLQTPPFPEYTSGHSVISRAAATVLTHLYGESFAFTDSTPEKFGQNARSFGSFYAASEEAAISRLYGGIHFMPAIEHGIMQGQKVGELVRERVRLTATQ